jgi:hypothetical protein
MINESRGRRKHEAKIIFKAKNLSAVISLVRFFVTKEMNIL